MPKEYPKSGIRKFLSVKGKIVNIFSFQNRVCCDYLTPIVAEKQLQTIQKETSRTVFTKNLLRKTGGTRMHKLLTLALN